jgi:hypothetical protein
VIDERPSPVSPTRPAPDAGGTPTAPEAGAAQPVVPPGASPPSGPNRWAARPVLRISRHHISTAVAIAGGLLVLGIILVVAVLPRFLSTPIGGPGPAPAAASSDARRIQATFFYVSEDGRELVQSSRQVLYGASPREQARHIIDAALEAPPEGQRSAVPAGTTVRSVFLAADQTLFVDLGGAVVSGHPGGSLNEALTVYAIVNAVTVNLPDVTGVQILVDGQQVDTLAGHIDLRYPLGKALDWVRKGS